MNAAVADFDISFAFQPIVDIAAGEVFAYEALVRGRSNEPASAVFRGIAVAAALGIDASLSLNFMPKSLDTLPDAISSTIDAARAASIPLQRIFLEVTENEIIHDPGRFASMMNSYLGGANSAIAAGDAASAKSFMEKAERQVEKLEKFLNR